MKKMISIIVSTICLVSCLNIPAYADFQPIPQGNDSLFAATYTRAGNVELCFADEDITALGDVTSHQIIYYIPIDEDVAKKDEIVLRNLKNGVATFEEIDFDKFDYYKFFVEVRTKSEVRYGNWGSQTPFTFTGISEVNYGYSILPDTDMPGGLEYANISVKQSGFDAPRPYGNPVQYQQTIKIPAPSANSRRFVPNWSKIADIPAVTGISAEINAKVLHRVTGKSDIIQLVHSVRGLPL